MSWSTIVLRKDEAATECDWRSQILQQEVRIEQLLKKVEVHKAAADELATQRERDLEQEKIKVHKLKQEAGNLRAELELTRAEVSGSKDDFSIFQERLELAESQCKRLADEKREILDAVRSAYERTANAEKKIDDISSLLLASERASLQISSEKATLDAKLQESESCVKAMERLKLELLSKISRLEQERDTERNAKLKIQEVRDRMVSDLDMMKKLVVETREENAHLQQKLMLADLNLKKLSGPENRRPLQKVSDLQRSSPGHVRVTLELLEDANSLPPTFQSAEQKKKVSQNKENVSAPSSRVFTVEELFASLGNR